MTLAAGTVGPHSQHRHRSDGTPMAQTFDPQAELVVKLVLGAFLAGSVLVIVVLVARSRADASVDAAIAQALPFSHKHHVGDVGLDCRMCHVTVETLAAPGMPGAAICLTCHSQLFADQALLAPLRISASSGRPIAWAQVYRLPDYVYFDHSVHVAKLVACVECHGRLDQMPLVRKAQALQMRWCIACHEDPAPHLHRRDQVFAMPPAPLPEAQARALAVSVGIESRQRLTDCSTCHR
jgi:hypothetical protein